MSLKHEFVKNTGFVGLSKILENLISYFIIILISRYLGANGLGQYSFIFAFVSLFFIFGDLGLSQLMVKDLSRNFKKINKYVSNILTLKIILAFVCFMVYFITLFFINKNEILLPLILVGVIQLITMFQNFYFSILRIENKGKVIAIANISERIIALVGAFIILTIFKSLTLFVLVLLLSSFVKTLITFFNSKKYFKYSFSLNWGFLFGLIKKSYPFLLITLFTLVYVRLDTIMLSFMKGDIVVGWYNSGYKLINVLNVIPIILLTFGFPMFSRLYSKNKKVLRELFENMLKYSLLLIIPIVVGVFFVGYRILEFIYRFGSVESAIAFNILIVAEVFVFLTVIMGNLIAAADKQKVFAKIAGFGALFNVILNFALIPKYSLYGAGIATAITYFLMFILMYVYIQKKIIKFSFFKYLIIPLISSLVMGVVLNNILNLHLILIVLVSVLVYGGVVGVIEVFVGENKKCSRIN